jgi:hypothetical protein
MNECGFEQIDLLKLDIEGAEREIFNIGDLESENARSSSNNMTVPAGAVRRRFSMLLGGSD